MFQTPLFAKGVYTIPPINWEQGNNEIYKENLEWEYKRFRLLL